MFREGDGKKKQNLPKVGKITDFDKADRDLQILNMLAILSNNLGN